MKILSTIVLASMLSMASLAMSQEAPRNQPPRRQGPPTVIKCDEMKQLMELVRQHRQTCEVCKTNIPPQRGPMGPGGRGQGGERRGPGPR